jgi:hypothetical protein
LVADPTLHVTTVQWWSSLHRIAQGKDGEIHSRPCRDEADLVESMLPVSACVAIGEIPIGLTFVKYAYAYTAKRRCAARLCSYREMFGDSHFAVLSNKAGKPFIDYYRDDESMGILAQSGEFANRKGIHPRLPGADKIQYVQTEVLEAKAFEEKKKDLGKIFLP